MKKHFDFLIIGGGIGGAIFSKILEKKSHSFLIININKSYNSSRIAGGFINPYVLRYYTPVNHINLILKYYKRFNDEFFQFTNSEKGNSIHKILTTEEEQIQYDNLLLNPTNSQFISKKTEPFHNYKSVRIKKSSKININNFFDSVNNIQNENFDYTQLKVTNFGFEYKDIIAKKILFSEGFGINQNPFFDFVKLPGTKGEALEVEFINSRIPSNVKNIAGKSVLLGHISDDKWYLGSTYDWKNINTEKIEISKEFLLKKLESLNLPIDSYKITNHFVGIRPTVLDRNGIIGKHPNINNMYVLNGLGTRGALLAPYFGILLYDFIYNNEPIPKHLNVSRLLPK